MILGFGKVCLRILEDEWKWPIRDNYFSIFKEKRVMCVFFFGGGEIPPNFYLKNMISTYTKEFFSM
jgi:hypothetical protein